MSARQRHGARTRKVFLLPVEQLHKGLVANSGEVLNQLRRSTGQQACSRRCVSAARTSAAMRNAPTDAGDRPAAIAPARRASSVHPYNKCSERAFCAASSEATYQTLNIRQRVLEKSRRWLTFVRRMSRAPSFAVRRTSGLPCRLAVRGRKPCICASEGATLTMAALAGGLRAENACAAPVRSLTVALVARSVHTSKALDALPRSCVPQRFPGSSDCEKQSAHLRCRSCELGPANWRGRAVATSASPRWSRCQP